MQQTVRKRTSSTIPFGYDEHPENPHMLVENILEKETLEYIKERAHSLSLRQIASVIEARTGRRITPSGISGLMKRKY